MSVSMIYLIISLVVSLIGYVRDGGQDRHWERIIKHCGQGLGWPAFLVFGGVSRIHS